MTSLTDATERVIARGCGKARGSGIEVCVHRPRQTRQKAHTCGWEVWKLKCDVTNQPRAHSTQSSPTSHHLATAACLALIGRIFFLSRVKSPTRTKRKTSRLLRIALLSSRGNSWEHLHIHGRRITVLHHALPL